MQGLLYGVKPERWTPPDEPNHLLVGLAHVPMRLEDLEHPTPIRDDWVVAKTRLTGICGSDAKKVFCDFGDDFSDSALNGFFTLPTVLGHEVVADVVEVGPGVTALEVGQRVVLNPWLSCGPRGIDPPCPSCQAGDYSLCWHFTQGPLAAGIHTGTSKDAPGGFAEYLPAHESMFIPFPTSRQRRGGCAGRPVRRVVAFGHPSPAAPRGEGACLRRRRARAAGHGHPARPLPRRRHHGGGPVSRPGRAGSAPGRHRRSTRIPVE